MRDLHLHLDSDTHRDQKSRNLPRDPPGASRNGRSQRPDEISRRARESTTPHQAKGGRHASRGRGASARGSTVAVLVEEAEGLLELGDLVVGELVRHGSPGEGSDGGRETGRERGEARMEEVGEGSPRGWRREDETRWQRPTGLVGSTRHLPCLEGSYRAASFSSRFFL
jgi:hypothetical protein